MKMLGRKNLCYSLLLAAVMMILLIGYFIWMLPSLYVSYVEEQNLAAVKEQHQAFIETGSYDHVRVKNPTACLSVKIPYQEPYVEFTSKMISLKIIVTEQELQQLLKEIQANLQDLSMDQLAVRESDPEKESRRKQQESDAGSPESDTQKTTKNSPGSEPLKKRMADWQNNLALLLQKGSQLPFRIETLHEKDDTGLYYGESFQIHKGAGNEVILESAVHDENNQYTNYLAFEKVSDGVVCSMLPVVTPQMEEIRPVVLQSIPMLCAVILILVLLFSQIYSNGIVRPVYQKLQDINRNLLEENERQEMFLRATSHQLKTPITAALLLLDGMIAQIGKYKDRETYLPKVKEQLLSMRRMTDEILSTHRKRDQTDWRSVPLYTLVQTQTASYQVAAAEKQLEITIEGDQKATVWADADLLAKIVDNLLSNAVAYTPGKNHIRITISGTGVTIRNEGAAIPNEILPHLFEPFVRGEHGSGSHGLGLYIAAYYAKIMHAVLDVRNQENGVEAVLKFSKKSVS